MDEKPFVYKCEDHKELLSHLLLHPKKWEAEEYQTEYWKKTLANYMREIFNVSVPPPNLHGICSCIVLLSERIEMPPDALLTEMLGSDKASLQVDHTKLAFIKSLIHWKPLWLCSDKFLTYVDTIHKLGTLRAVSELTYLQMFEHCIDLCLVCAEQMKEIDIFCAPSSHNSHYEIDLSLNSDIVNCKLLLNLESSSKVAKAAETCLKKLLRHHGEISIEERLVPFLKRNFQSINSRNQWTEHTGHIMLQLALPYLGAAAILAEYPSLPLHLSTSLLTNKQATSSVKAYKALINSITHIQWQAHFKEIFGKILNTENKILQRNFILLWIPPTISKFPDLFKDILLLICSTNEGFLAKLFILRVGRSKGLVQVNNTGVIVPKSYDPTEPIMLWCTLSKCLVHYNNDIRVTCFSLLVDCQKQSEALSRNESDYILEFIQDNATIDSSSFRMEFLKYFHILINRLKCVIRTAFVKCNFNESYVISKELLKSIFENVFENIELPGNYQRTLTALRQFQLLNDVIGFANIDTFIDVIKIEGHYDVKFGQFMLKKSILSIFMFCMHDMVDVRLAASNIVKSVHNSIDGDLVLCLKRAMKLCDNPRFSTAQGGATLLRACLCVNKNSFDDYRCFQGPKLPEVSWEDVLLSLFSQINDEFSLLQENIFEASCTQPMHGVITALTFLLEDVSVLKCSIFMSIFLPNCIHLCRAVVYFLLQVTRLENDMSDDSPSFCDIDLAVRKKIEKCSGVEPTNDNVQLVISCCWLTIKCCCVFLNFVVHELTEYLSANDIEESILTIIKVLLCTRHKGALEAAHLALKNISDKCHMLNGNLLTRRIVQEQIHNVIKKICVIETSVTRRSAGIAMICSSSCANSDFAEEIMKELIEIFSKEHWTEDKEKWDMPSINALHCLKSIILDCRTTLSDSLAATILNICVRAFDSDLWGMRNASLQLYGALIADITHKKSVKDDSPIDYSINASTFTAHFPLVSEIILKFLAEDVIRQNHFRSGWERIIDKMFMNETTNCSLPVACYSDKRNTSLVAILGLLARLKRDDNSYEFLYPCCKHVVKYIDHPDYTVRKLTVTILNKLMHKSSNCEYFEATLLYVNTFTSITANQVNAFLLHVLVNCDLHFKRIHTVLVKHISILKSIPYNNAFNVSIYNQIISYIEDAEVIEPKVKDLTELSNTNNCTEALNVILNCDIEVQKDTDISSVLVKKIVEFNDRKFTIEGLRVLSRFLRFDDCTCYDYWYDKVFEFSDNFNDEEYRLLSVTFINISNILISDTPYKQKENILLICSKLLFDTDEVRYMASKCVQQFLGILHEISPIQSLKLLFTNLIEKCILENVDSYLYTIWKISLPPMSHHHTCKKSILYNSDNDCGFTEVFLPILIARNIARFQRCTIDVSCFIQNCLIDIDNYGIGACNETNFNVFKTLSQQFFEALCVSD